jgi:oxygen-independent coproporphyrinogen-3 oxidase
MPPRAAYIHVPFCRHRCGYCNFTLVAGRDDLIEAYLEAIKRELSWLETPREVDTLFFGGGTPTHLQPNQLRRLFKTARQWFPLAAGFELSVEANPADLNDEIVGVLAEQGVTRISLGVQSFNAAKLEILERDHRADEVGRAFQLARGCAQSVSLDLIFGVPGESLEMWEADLAAALALEPDHISTYGLTFERGTAFWSRLLKHELTRADEELERAMYLSAIDKLTAAGFEHYEVSNFARPGHRCRHNQTYWSGREYYAAGPGAASYIAGRREINHRSTTTYIQRVLAGQSPVADSEQLDPEDAARERLVFGLRQLDGVDRAAFAAETGYDIDELVGDALRKHVALGLFESTVSLVRLTRAGLLVSDSIWPDVLQH